MYRTTRPGATAQQMPLRVILLACVLLFAGHAAASDKTAVWELQSLAQERETLTRELEQYEKTISMLHPEGVPAEESSNPAVKTLVQETVAIRKRLIEVTEREVTLLQEHIIARRTGAATSQGQPDNPDIPIGSQEAMESKPLEIHSTTYSLACTRCSPTTTASCRKLR
jgi:hypothetical protein